MKPILDFLNDHHTVAYLIALVGFCTTYALLKNRKTQFNHHDHERLFHHYWDVRYGRKRK